ncbi:hypothetical protein THAOC_37571 [Thalassiosira oceanica]|uniref:RING-type domain-containing protein n=1 Tax=Thalassiosira oceanica TaxID=159749 RepID=K0R5Q9_THAOC|nr:hypothetical protein THAOC_37571 [Thalassiosira oceanica]|eukprot:EJK43936.1 hypothetical protein THAOC_37571 [Thalassiosira oceanica]
MRRRRKKEDVKAAARTSRILLNSGDDMSLAEEQHQPPAPAAPVVGPIPDAVTEEELMNSGHELPEGYTCPLCCLPIALPAAQHSRLNTCCMKMVCHGCIVASAKRGIGDTCAFCRTPTPDSSAAILALVRKRVDAKDPEATEFLARIYYDGKHGLKQETSRAIELWTEAARLGDFSAHFQLGPRYYFGQGVEQDVARGIRHLQHAAIQGDPDSRLMLGCHEYKSGNHELALRHFMISAKMGDEDSLNRIKGMFKKGHATKAQYAEALKGYQTALEETKSPQREVAKKIQWKALRGFTPLHSSSHALYSDQSSSPNEGPRPLKTWGTASPVSSWSIRGADRKPRRGVPGRSEAQGKRIWERGLGGDSPRLPPCPTEIWGRSTASYVCRPPGRRCRRIPPGSLIPRSPTGDGATEMGSSLDALPGGSSYETSHSRVVLRRMAVGQNGLRTQSLRALGRQMTEMAEARLIVASGRLRPPPASPVSPTPAPTDPRRSPRPHQLLPAIMPRAPRYSPGVGGIGRQPARPAPLEEVEPVTPGDGTSCASFSLIRPSHSSTTPSGSGVATKDGGGGGAGPVTPPPTAPGGEELVGRSAASTLLPFPREGVSPFTLPQGWRRETGGPRPSILHDPIARSCPFSSPFRTVDCGIPGAGLDFARGHDRSSVKGSDAVLGPETPSAPPPGKVVPDTQTHMSTPLVPAPGGAPAPGPSSRQSLAAGGRAAPEEGRPNWGSVSVPGDLPSGRRSPLRPTRRAVPSEGRRGGGEAPAESSERWPGHRQRKIADALPRGPRHRSRRPLSKGIRRVKCPPPPPPPTSDPLRGENADEVGIFLLQSPPPLWRRSTQDLGGRTLRRLTDLPFAATSAPEEGRRQGSRTRILLDIEDDMSLAEDQHQPPAQAVPAAGLLPDAVTEEELMSSGHELPERYTCPLCCLPIALPITEHSKFESCCMKQVCDGCILASNQRGLGDTCAFCRAPTPDSDAAKLALVQKRVDAKDPKATEILAEVYYHGDWGLKIDTQRANELWTEAARLGDLEAHFRLGHRYYKGEGVRKDRARAIRHCKHAAIQGHPESRHVLGLHEHGKGNHELGVRHFMISAKMGFEESLDVIKDKFMEGHATKAQYAEALRGYQNALEETKSPQREEVKAFSKSD